MDKESMERRRQSRYISASFVVPVGILTTVCFYFLVVLLLEEWTRIALLKGFIFCIVAYSSYYFYKTAKKFLQKWKKERAR